MSERSLQIRGMEVRQCLPTVVNKHRARLSLPSISDLVRILIKEIVARAGLCLRKYGMCMMYQKVCVKLMIHGADVVVADFLIIDTVSVSKCPLQTSLDHTHI